MRSRYLSRLFPVVYLQQVDPAGGTTGDPAPPVPPQKHEPDFKALAAAAVAEVLSKKDNDAQAALLTLAGRNARLEHRAVTAESNLLSDADRATLQAAKGLLQETGVKDFNELKTIVTNGKTAIENEARRTKADARKTAVAADGFDADKVALLNGIDGFEFEARPVTVDGKTAHEGYAKGKLADGTEFNGRVSELLPRLAPSLVDSLKASTQQEQPGTYVPAMATTGRTTGGDDAYWEAERKAKEAKRAENPAGNDWRKAVGAARE
jgi:hypothetical protein